MICESLKGILQEAPCTLDADHKYTAKENGEWWPGTTTIADQLSKDFLGPWYAKEMFLELSVKLPITEVKTLEDAKSAARRKADAAKNSGTIAHDFVEQWINAGMTAENVAGTLLPEDEGAGKAISAFLKWVEGRKIDWLATEEVVGSTKYKFGGKIDSLANYNKITTLVDIKTSNQISAAYLLQLAGYDIALSEMGFSPRQWLIVRLPKDGSDAETLTVKDRTVMDFCRETFLRLREVHKFSVFVENNMVDPKTKKIRTDGTS